MSITRPPVQYSSNTRPDECSVISRLPVQPPIGGRVTGREMPPAQTGVPVPGRWTGNGEPKTAPDGPSPAQRRGLYFLIAQLGSDELRVLERLAQRLLEGRRRYGELSLATDARDFRQERADEIADLLVYTAFLELQAASKESP